MFVFLNFIISHLMHELSHSFFSSVFPFYEKRQTSSAATISAALLPWQQQITTLSGTRITDGLKVIAAGRKVTNTVSLYLIRYYFRWSCVNGTSDGNETKVKAEEKPKYKGKGNNMFNTSKYNPSAG